VRIAYTSFVGMKTEVLSLLGEEGYWNHVRRAASVLASGGLVAFPTETVYGLGANAADPDAMRRLRDVKGRHEAKPFTLHIPRRSALEQYVPELTRIGKRLTEKAWPGPLTLVLPVAEPARAPIIEKLPDRKIDSLYHEGTIGVRCPDSKHAGDVIAEAKVPIVAASANLAGSAAPVRADDVMEDLDGKIDLVLDGGTTRYAKASTIVRVNGDGYTILREGVYDERMIRRFLTVNLLFVCTGNTCRSPMAAAVCRKLLAERLGCAPEALDQKGYGVLSAGAFAMPGSPASPGALHAMEIRGLDLAGHRAQPVSVELIHTADYIFPMSQSQADLLVQMVPSAGHKIRLLDEKGDIDDPIGGEDSIYEACAERIEAALKRRLEEIPL